jgi:hypothetical protein
MEQEHVQTGFNRLTWEHEPGTTVGHGPGSYRGAKRRAIPDRSVQIDE